MKHKYASIDVGTNSIRCLLTTMEGEAFLEAEKVLEMTRIGEGVNATKKLQMERIESSVNAIKHFAKLADDYGAERTYIMATSAVRDAENRAIFIERVKSEAGLTLEVISGNIEAEMGFKGVMAGAQRPMEKKLVIDIGGGSTEFIVGNEVGRDLSLSIDIGAVRLTNLFAEDYEAMIDYIEQKSAQVLEKINLMEIDEVIGIGGTATTFLTMKKEMTVYDRALVHNQAIKTDEIHEINLRLRAMSAEQRRHVPGLEPKRSDIICAGGTILEHIMNRIAKRTMIISDFDNLEGFLVYKLKEEKLI